LSDGCRSPALWAGRVTSAYPIFERIRESCFESRTLAALRDALLPRLLSGEFNLKEYRERS
jgi:hypothetical protein